MIDDLLMAYPASACDRFGSPFAWDECHICVGAGDVPVLDQHGRYVPDSRSMCGACGGFGSLRLAALDALVRRHQARELAAGAPTRVPPRCQRCGHPYGGATYTGGAGLDPAAVAPVALEALLAGAEPNLVPAVGTLRRWSRCDALCRHGGPVRYLPPGTDPDGALWAEDGSHAGDPSTLSGLLPAASVVGLVRQGCAVEALWRDVDVRRTAGLHDLRLELLRLTCGRCEGELHRGAIT